MELELLLLLRGRGTTHEVRSAAEDAAEDELLEAAEGEFPDPDDEEVVLTTIRLGTPLT